MRRQKMIEKRKNGSPGQFQHFDFAIFIAIILLIFITTLAVWSSRLTIVAACWVMKGVMDGTAQAH